LTLKKKELYENLYAKVKRFQEKWEPQIEKIKYRTISITPKRGEHRKVYLLVQNKYENESVVAEFLASHKRLAKRIESDLEELREKDSRAASMIDMAFPLAEQGCFSVHIKAYVAISPRELDRKQARNFLAKINKDFPENAAKFYIRSKSGRRYRLRLGQKGRTPEYPLHAWSVIVSTRQLSEEEAPSEARPAGNPAGVKAWGKANKLTFLGRNLGRNGEKGKSFLYCRMKKPKKVASSRTTGQ
jgi:hypothetical protein